MAAPATAASAADAAKRIGLVYDIYSGGLHVLALDLDLGLGLDTGRYDVTAKISTAGFLAWFLDWNQVTRSEGTLGEGGVAPDLYRMNATFRGNARMIEIVYRNGQVAVVRAEPSAKDDGEREVVAEAQRRDTLDPMSGVLAVIHATSEGKGCNGRVPVFDGRRRYDMVFVDRGERQFSASRYSVFDGRAKQCDFVFESIAGFERRRPENEERRRLQSGRAWISPVMPGAPATPVRIELDGDWGMTIAHLRDIRRGAATAVGAR
ncbi:MAG: DUF3108 domain-containing protein [Rhodospirillales bacterium]|nr:DUF3108 domain-containing protein [Rhodospirillales bacterium]